MISIIAAIGKNRELGRGNKLLWHISEDLKRFRELTKGHAVIMGRKTFESLGKPLPNRLNIVVSRNCELKSDNPQVKYFSSLQKAVDEGKKFGGEVFIIGGGEIYRQGLPLADKLYLTLVDADCPEADTYFPDYSTLFHVDSKKEREGDGYKYSFVILEKNAQH